MEDIKDKDKTLKVLEEHYNSIKNQTDAWDFFLNTAEYVKFVRNNSMLIESIKKLEDERKKVYEAFQVIDNKTIKELQKASSSLLQAVERQKISFEPLNEAVRELKAYNSGRLLTSLSKAHALDRYLFDVARALKASGFTEFIQRFEDENKKINNIYGNFTFSPTLVIRDIAEKNLNYERKKQMWGAWEDLPTIERYFFNEIDVDEELKNIPHKGKLKRWEMMELIAHKPEFGYMQEKQKSDEHFVFFKVKDFRKKIDRIHKYLVTELLVGHKDDVEQKGTYFDADKSIWIVNGIEIKIKKFSVQYHTLNIICNSGDGIGQEWFFSDIAEQYDSSANIPDKKFSNAIYQIKQKLLIKGIDDFFITTRQSVKINSKYLT